MRGPLVFALLAAAAFPTTATASGADCGDGAAIDLAGALQQRPDGIDHIWGKENIAWPNEATSGGSPVLRVAYPAGSFSPGAGKVRGGAGFELRQAPAPAACLSYAVRFPKGFDFNKGGKLPGLFGGDAPRGCLEENGPGGFSARLMWREGGLGELYLYAPNREQRCGARIGRGSFAFSPGRWTQVTQRVSIGPPGAGNGVVEVWVDGKLAIRADRLTLGRGPSASVDGLLFSTFFGGGDASWASARDQFADFAGFRMAPSPN